MNEKDKLSSLREEIDAADASLIRSFLERMDVSARIAELKRGAGMPTRDPDREREKLRAVTADVDPAMRPYAEVLYSLLFDEFI